MSDEELLQPIPIARDGVDLQEQIDSLRRQVSDHLGIPPEYLDPKDVNYINASIRYLQQTQALCLQRVIKMVKDQYGIS